MSDLTAARIAYAALSAAQEKLQRNVNTCVFLDATRREADPFLAYADLLARLEARKNEALAVWNKVAVTLTVEEIVSVMTA